MSACSDSVNNAISDPRGGATTLDAADEKGRWIAYRLINRQTGKEEPKLSWVVRYRGLVFGAGMHVPLEQWTQALVDQAINEYRRFGTRAFKRFSVAGSEYHRGEISVFVLDAKHGTVLAHITPGLLGTSLPGAWVARVENFVFGAGLYLSEAEPVAVTVDEMIAEVESDTMSPHNSDFVFAVLKENTVTTNAAQDPNGLHLVMQNILFVTGDEELSAAGLPDEDVKTLRELDVSRRPIIPAFQVIANDMQTILDTEPVNAVALGQLLNTARAKESKIHAATYREGIARLSESGRKAITERVVQAGRDLNYEVRDWAGIGDRVPGVVVDVSRDFIAGMKEYQKLLNEEPAGPIVERQGNWEIVR